MVTLAEESPVLISRTGSLGRIRLNRPKAINALTVAMIETLDEALHDFADDPGVTAVLIDGAGERGLCAGGDVRAVREAIVAGADHRVFFEREYAMNARIAHFAKPYVAWMDGIVMGGGVGVSVHGSLRITTERTRLAMPETIIGFFPDVGALFHLARTPGRIGTRLALTGMTIDGADAVAAGLADTVVESDRFAELADRLAAGHRLDPTVGATDLPSGLAAAADELDPLYAGDTAAEIIAALEDSPVPAAAEDAAAIRLRSPLAVCLTLAALRRAADLSVDEVLAQDARLAGEPALLADFAEGVRAQLVDKDRTPRWRDARIEDVDETAVAALVAGATR